MRTALDSKILSAFWSNEPTAAAIARKLNEAKRQGSLVLSPVAYAELFAHPTTNEVFREDFFRQMDIAIDFDMTPQAWAETGRRFARYAHRRRRSGGGEARRLVPDFALGAHALLQADRLLTNDIDRYDRDFSRTRSSKTRRVTGISFAAHGHGSPFIDSTCTTSYA